MILQMKRIAQVYNILKKYENKDNPIETIFLRGELWIENVYPRQVDKEDLLSLDALGVKTDEIHGFYLYETV